MNHTLFLIILLTMLTASAVSLFLWKRLSKADRWIAVLLCTTFLSELLTEYFGNRFRNNMPVYHFFNPVQYLLLCLYFNESITKLKRHNTGIWIGIGGVLLSVYTNFFVQDIYTFPSIFLIFESFMIIALCLFSYFDLFLKEDIEINKQAHFWITTILLLFWSFTFVVWGMLTVFLNQASEFMKMVYPILITINFITYAGITMIFLNYHKLVPSGE